MGTKILKAMGTRGFRIRSTVRDKRCQKIQSGSAVLIGTRYLYSANIMSYRLHRVGVTGRNRNEQDRSDMDWRLALIPWFVVERPFVDVVIQAFYPGIRALCLTNGTGFLMIILFLARMIE